MLKHPVLNILPATKPKTLSRILERILITIWCPERDLNPHAVKAKDFESFVSTIPPSGQDVFSDVASELRAPHSLRSGVRLSNIRFRSF